MRAGSLRLRKWTPSTALSALGLATALVYLLAFSIPYSLPAQADRLRYDIYRFTAEEPWRGVLFCVALAFALALYVMAYRLISVGDEAGFSPWLVGGWTLVFCGLLLPILPLASSDLYAYLFQGRIVSVLGENPFIHLYGDFAGDPYYFLVTFGHLPASTGYGPLWIGIAAGLGWLAREQVVLNLLLFKALAAGLHLISTFLVYQVLGTLQPEKRLAGTLFYAWNPLLLFELVGNGHNDAVVATLALLGFLLLTRSRAVLAVPCFAAAVLVKPVAAIWLPLVALWLIAREANWRARMGTVMGIVLLSLLPAVLAYAPFWEGVATFQGIVRQSDISGNSLPHLLILAGREMWPAARRQVVDWVKLLTATVFLPFYAWQLLVVWHASSGGEGRLPGLATLVRASFDVVLLYLVVVGFQFWPWYLTWLLVSAVLLVGNAARWRRTMAIVACVLAPLLYFPFGVEWAREGLPGWLRALLAAGPLVALGLWLVFRSWRARSIA